MLNFNITEKVSSNAIDAAAILGISLTSLDMYVKILIASLIGISLVVKNVYDILIRRKQLKKLEDEQKIKIISPQE